MTVKESIPIVIYGKNLFTGLKFKQKRRSGNVFMNLREKVLIPFPLFRKKKLKIKTEDK